MTTVCYVCGEEIGSVAYVGGDILNMLMLVWKNFYPRRQHFWEKFVRLGENK
jgi:hypothetical protein